MFPLKNIILLFVSAVLIASGHAQLSGTVIGTPGSYANSSWTVDKAFDGNFSTFFDAPSAGGSWAGLDLGTAQVIGQVKFCPRATFGSRMVGGVFQGANTPDFSGAVTFYTVASAPADGVLTAQTVSNGTAFRYVRYLSPGNGFCNVADLQFFATSSPTPTPTPVPTPTPPPGGGQLTGAVVGTAGSYGGSPWTADKAFDGNLATFFDAPVAGGAWAGLDLGTAKVVSEIRFCPRSGWASRMTGGIFQGANSADFSGAVTLYTVVGNPAESTLTAQTVSNGTAFRYVRYLSPANGWCNVAEVAFFGPGGSPPPTPTPPPAAPSAPTNLTATAGNSQIVLNWNVANGATSYSVKVGLSSGGPYVAQASVTENTYTDTNLTNGTTYYYVVTASNGAGESGSSNQASATPASGGGTGGGTIANGSFETPATPGFVYNPSGATWGFTGNAGVQRNGSAFSGTIAVAPDGVQTAFLQSNGPAGAMAQTVGFTSGTCTISFRAARRWGTVQPVRVSVDSTVVGTYTPSSNNFEQITTAPFAVTAGNHTVTFAATDATGDKATFVDLISIGGSGGGPAPAAPAGLVAVAGNTQVSLTWAASSGATSYNIYRGTATNGQSTTPVATGVATTSYTNTGLTNGLPYFYKVRAVGASGTSANSNEAMATPLSGGGDIDLSGYTLTFADEFDSFSATVSSPKGSSTWYAKPVNSYGYFSASIWDIATFSVTNGILSAKAYLDASNNWHSGILYSVDPNAAGFSQQYGYFAMRCRMPNSSTGAWPAFWLETLSAIPGNSNLEIDIFEWYGVCNTPGSFQAVMQQATHNWKQDGSQDQVAPHLYSPQTPMPGGAFPWQDYHIYGCKIDPQHITWYIDGVQTNQIATPTAYMSGPFFIIIDYALGGGWPLSGMVNNSSLDIDWVRVYALPP